MNPAAVRCRGHFDVVGLPVGSDLGAVAEAAGAVSVPGTEVEGSRAVGAAPASLGRDDMAAGNIWRNGLHAMPTFPNIDRTWLNGDRTHG